MDKAAIGGWTRTRRWRKSRLDLSGRWRRGQRVLLGSDERAGHGIFVDWMMTLKDKNISNMIIIETVMKEKR